jgi:hypothetical protein
VLEPKSPFCRLIRWDTVRQVNRSDIELGLSIGTFVVTMVGLGGLYAQIRSAALSQARDHDRQRKQATLDTFVGSAAERHAILQQLPNDRDIEAVRAFCPAPDAVDDPRFQVIIAHLNYFENLAVGAEHDIYCPKVIDSLVGGRLVAAWVAYEPFIQGRRQLLGASSVWSGFETLAGQLRPARNGEIWMQGDPDC